MVTINNAIFLKEKNKLFLEFNPRQNAWNPQKAATIIKNIESLGYVFDTKLINLLIRTNERTLIKIYENLYTTLKEKRGWVRPPEPMYKNFPSEVMEKEDCELYMNAIVHYFTGDVPEGERERKLLPKETYANLELIEYGTPDDYVAMFEAILTSKTSISNDNGVILTLFAHANPEIYREMFETLDIPFKEILAYASSIYIDLGGSAYKVKNKYKTATDVLRLAVALSGGDVSLTENPSFKKFSKSTRRFLLELLNNVDNSFEDMYRYKNSWKRLGEILHPGQYSSRYPNAYQSFYAIRNDGELTVFNGIVEKHLANGNTLGAIRLLSTRPGELVRRIDHIIRLGGYGDELINALEDCVDRVSIPVLLQAYSHFNSRVISRLYNIPRIIFPKGRDSKMYAVPGKPIPEGFNPFDMHRIAGILIQGMKDQFEEREDLGKVYIDPILRNYTIPMTQRSASRQLSTIGRGTRIPFEKDANTVRLFTHWMQPDGIVIDLDLSATLVSEGWTHSESVWYGNLRSGNAAYHSGDILIAPAPHGASEYIDIDLKTVRAKGLRYIVPTIRNYTDTKFTDLLEGCAGFMIRNEVNSGEIFEHRSVHTKFDLTSNEQTVVPFIIDVVLNEMIWLDVSKSIMGVNNVKNDMNIINEMIASYILTPKATLFDLFMIHAKCRGRFVESRIDADIVFAPDGHVKPTDINIIASQYL